MSYLIDPDTRLSLMFGSNNGKFQIPNNPGQDPAQSPYPEILGLMGLSG